MVSSPQIAVAPAEPPTRNIAVYFGAALLFVQTSFITEYLHNLVGGKLYLLYVVAPPAMLAALFSGALKRTLSHRSTWCWLAFLGWMAVGVPFSGWPGGSLNELLPMFKFHLPVMLTIAGICTSVKDVKIVFYALASAGAFLVFVTYSGGREFADRLFMWERGTISDPNDLASQLLCMVPFVLYLALGRQRNLVVRLGAGALGIMIFVQIFSTGSRGGFVALCLGFLVAMLAATGKQRMILLAVTAAIAVAVPLMVPQHARDRLLGFLYESESAEAAGSSATREYLFWRSVGLTFSHPVIGVGAGRFAGTVGLSDRAEGVVRTWHGTHCSWTQVSSEGGIPALLFFTGAIGFAYFPIFRRFLAARKEKDEEVMHLAFCAILAAVMYFGSISFLTNGYRAQVSIMVAVGIAVSYGLTRRRAMPQTVAG